MSLSIDISFDSITADRTTGTLIDNTIYGGSNPARNILGGFLSGNKLKFDASIDSALTITPNNSDPEIVSAWTFNIPKDGWFRFTFSLLPIYAGGTTYALNDAVYNPTLQNAYISLQAGNIGNALSNTSFWAVVADPGALAINEGTTSQSFNITSTVYQIIPAPNSEFAFASQIAITSTEGGDVDREQTVQLYELLAVFVDGLYVRSDRNQYIQGERLARRIQSVATEAGLL